MSSKSVSEVIKLKFCSPSVRLHDYFQLVCNSQGKKSSDKLWPFQNPAVSDICSDFYSPPLPHTPFIQFVLLLFFFFFLSQVLQTPTAWELNVWFFDSLIFSWWLAQCLAHSQNSLNILWLPPLKLKVNVVLGIACLRNGHCLLMLSNKLFF